MDLFESPKLQFLKKKEAFLQQALFAKNWGRKGSKQRVLATQTVIDYLEDVRNLVEQYPRDLPSKVPQTVNLFFERILPIPPDLVSSQELAEIAFKGDKSSEEALKRLQEGLL